MGLDRQVKRQTDEINALGGESEQIVKFHTRVAILRSKIKGHIEGEKNNKLFFRSKKASLHKRNYRPT